MKTEIKKRFFAKRAQAKYWVSTFAQAIRILALHLGEKAMLRIEVVDGVKRQAAWWIDTRLAKIASESHDTMEVNPFMAPLVSAIHAYKDSEELATFLIGGHFAIGHATGFGKLIDEKILPQVFKTAKLDKSYRTKTAGLIGSEFDNIDHVIVRDGKRTLLSQKASKWTIQLGQAVELNNSFAKIVQLKANGVFDFEEIVIATFYGKEENLTDKYNIVRGINRGANHDLTDLRDHVRVLAGQKFWSWIGGAEDTQQWVMEGFLEAIQSRKEQLKVAASNLEKYRKSFLKRYDQHLKEDGSIDWQKVLTMVNG